ncbi:DUF2922 domain-containing protein [Bacillus timonensis]|uniref:DUF2922 domain-containing protein n=1 Tax=Bacillus timonensis TaxID=1033734 RepID=A0A4S3PKE6_9BACI|nr:DUF2922 domain-containing protein [Bacillus timonensis]THE09927.1 DUF2922 domain-containing protein [Bacillus timonensis]
MAKTLEMQFKNEDGKTATISIENPIEPVDAVAVSAAMDLIISTNVFLTPGGAIVEKKGARVVERNVETVEL